MVEEKKVPVLTVNPTKEVLDYLQMDEDTYRQAVGRLLKDKVITITK